MDENKILEELQAQNRLLEKTVNLLEQMVGLLTTIKEDTTINKLFLSNLSIRRI